MSDNSKHIIAVKLFSVHLHYSSIQFRDLNIF